MQQQSPRPAKGAAYASDYCEVCGQMRMPGGMDWLSQWNQAYAAPWMESWNRAWGQVAEAWSQGMPWMQQAFAPQRATGSRPTSKVSNGGDCACRHCSADDCACRCCVSNADLLVYARFGERRVVPVVVENNLRREREVELQLSDWTTHAGQPAQVSGRLIEPSRFTLAACEERTALIVVEAGGANRANAVEQPMEQSSDAAAANRPNETEAGVPILTGRVELPDVDECRVFYADLRVKGCDIRPVRVAVAVLPRDCAAYRIDCRCGCC